jgi:hypothetical protein
MKSLVFALGALLGCTEITRTDWTPPDDDVPEARGGGGSVSYGSGGFGADQPVPETGVVGGYGIDVTQGGQIITLPLAPHRVFADAERGVVLAGPEGLPAGGNEIVPVLQVTHITHTGYQESFAFAYAGEQSSIDFGGAAVDDFGNVYVAGSYRGVMTLNGVTIFSLVNPGVPNPADPTDQHGKPSQDIFIFKLDRWGVVLWALSLGGVADQWVTSIALSPDGSLTLAGGFTGELWLGEGPLVSSGGSTIPDQLFLRVSADAVPLAARKFAGDVTPFRHAAIDSTGALVLGGNVPSSETARAWAGYEDLTMGPGGFVAKLDENFEPLWVKNLGQDVGPEVRAIALDHEDNVVVAGNAFGEPDLFGEPTGTSGIVLAKLDPDGAPLFGRLYGNSPDDAASAVTVLSDDSIAFTGHFLSDVDFGGGTLLSLEPGAATDVFVARVDPDGEHLMSLRAGGVGVDYGLSIATLPGDRLATVGTFTTAIDFGSGIVLNRGGPYVAWITP